MASVLERSEAKRSSEGLECRLQSPLERLEERFPRLFLFFAKLLSNRYYSNNIIYNDIIAAANLSQCVNNHFITKIKKGQIRSIQGTNSESQVDRFGVVLGQIRSDFKPKGTNSECKRGKFGVPFFGFLGTNVT